MEDGRRVKGKTALFLMASRGVFNVSVATFEIYLRLNYIL